jgi:hypothetical protein
MNHFLNHIWAGGGGGIFPRAGYFDLLRGNQSLRKIPLHPLILYFFEYVFYIEIPPVRRLVVLLFKAQYLHQHHALYEYLVCLSHVSCFMHSTSILSAVSCFLFYAFYEYLVCLSHVSCFVHSTSILSACLMLHVLCILRASCLPVSCFMF